VLLVWLAVSGWSAGLHLRAALDPPVGRAFAGNFHWIDDFYNYLSYAQQAEGGQLLFRNKLAAQGSPRLVNVEWWLVGTASRWLGGRLLLAYALLGVVATLALLAAAERWLALLAVPPSRRAAALALLAFGGGLGGLIFELTDLGVARCAELSVAVFPYLEIAGNPHFVAGTALLLWTLWFFSEQPTPRGTLLGILTGSVLALARPYEIGLLVAMRVTATLVIEPRTRWLRSLLPLVGLAPAMAYDAWVFFGTKEFATFRQGGAFPGRLEAAAALGPVLLLALSEWRRPVRGGEHRRARLQLWAWAATGLLLLATRPGGFSLQLAVGLGVPLLLLAGAALSELDGKAAVLVTLLFATSAAVETRILIADDPNWFVPAERLATARALRQVCRTGDRLLAPPDVSLYAIGLSACDAYVAHRAASDFVEHFARAHSFYAAMTPAERRSFLASEGLTQLVLPGWAGPEPVAWLGAGSAFRSARVIGAPRPQLSIYSRSTDSPGAR
jgi:hypothetical protein